MYAHKKNILIIAGGTGGHISPGIALFEEFKEKSNIYFLTLNKNKDYEEFKKKQIHPYYYNAPQIPKNIKDLIIFFYKFILSLISCIKIIKKHKIQIVIGMGGYPAFPGLLAGILLRKRIYLCEQNIVPGFITKLFARFSEKIFLAFPIKDKKYQTVIKKSIVTGNPIRKELFEIYRTINHVPKTIFITGGSQGAKQINEMVWNLWIQYPEFSKQYKWIIQTGKLHYEEFSRKIETLDFYYQIECFGFTTEIYKYFTKSDILICRAGAGNITEGILFSLPMILIPYPFAKDNHQFENAKYIEEKNCGIVIYSKTEEPELLYSAMNEIINNYQMYYKNIIQLRYKENPSRIIVQEILKD